MSLERKTEINPEEIEDNELEDDKSDFLYPEDNWDDDELDETDEPQEREYCD